MKMRLLSTFLVLMGLLLIQPVLANYKPDLNDNKCTKGENCDSANDGRRDYFLKLKYLEDIGFRVSLSDFHRVSSSRYQVSSDEFCAIAYSCLQSKDGKDCRQHNNRTMHDYQMQVLGFTAIENQSFVLSNQRDGSTIPVTLRLRGVPGDAAAGYDQVMNPGVPVIPQKEQGKNFCRHNEFVIIAEINAKDLEGAAGEYEGDFIVEVSATPEIPAMTANDDLEVELELPPSILISGLEDRDFVYTGKNISDTQEFCVYTSEKNGKFKIKADSDAGKDSFELSNGTAADNIKYEVSVGRVNGGNGNSIPLKEGVYDTHSSWRGARDLFCRGGKNMTLTLDINESDINGKPSGVYNDTLYLTVAPT